MAHRILLVGEAISWAETLSAEYSAWNLVVDRASTGNEALAALKDPPDLVLLGLDLPDMSGLACLKALRQTEPGRELPVIMVAARRGEAETAEAFDWGADDFAALDCEPAERVARVRAVLRRRFEREESVGRAMSVGPVALDPARHECRVRGRLVALRPREFELLEILMRKAGRVLSRSYLLETVWGMSRRAETRAVDVGVSRLRAALGRRAGAWLETVERFGYRFRTE